MAVASLPAAAAESHTDVPSCDKLRLQKGEFIEIVNSDLSAVTGSVLDVGIVDFTKTRSLHNAAYVASSHNVSVQTGLGGEELRVVQETGGRSCGAAKITPLSFEFDGSSLPPGNFEQPLSVFREEFGKPVLQAKVQQVTGIVRRVWIEAEAQSVPAKNGLAYRVRLSNAGNVATGALRLIVTESHVLEILKNDCDGHALAPAAGCNIEVTLDIARLQNGREEDEIPIGMGGVDIVENTLWLNVRDRQLKAFTTNR